MAVAGPLSDIYSQHWSPVLFGIARILSPMDPENSSIRKLASTSLRLNIVLLCALSLALLLVGTCYWALARVVQEEKDKISFHFSRLMGDIRDHESFLLRIAQQSDAATQKRDQDTVPLQRRLLMREGDLEIHEGREFSFSLPFTLATREHASPSELSGGPFSIGVMVANYYSSFWSTSAYPAPKTVLLNLTGDTSLAVPSLNSSPGHGGLARDTYLEVIGRILERLREKPPPRGDMRVHWGRAGAFYGNSQALLGHISVDLPDELWWENSPTRQLVAVTLLEMARINDFVRLLGQRFFTELALMEPGGEVVYGPAELLQGADEGMSLTRRGVLMKLGSLPDGGWVAVYRIDYESFFSYARWQLLGILAALFGCIGGGWYASHWYSRRVVLPARQAHSEIVESEVFSRAVIHTAPVALCVLRRDTREVLLQNRLAELWLGDAQEITRLSRDWDFSQLPEEAGGDICAVLGERYLYARFAPTRYHGEDVVLCAFNDITTHKDAQSALVEAKRSADAASEAKTLFLATMSHEIRTPLYGVLGTLELLGLTSLTRQQQEYLSTIQRSSSTLLQLISDILDVSKIEAGQMALEEVEFSPLELAEEVMRGHAAMAESKGLQLYSCLDAGLPGLLHGDAARIRQILNNLLSNALKFTDFGRVVLRLKVLERRNGQVQLQWQVTDTGIGISQEQQRRLFEPFYQVHGHQHTIAGTGLGLSICWNLSQMLNGTLRVVSEVGLGSSFSLALRLEVVEERQVALDGVGLQEGSIYVRAPARELAAGFAAWVERWGAIGMVVEQLPEAPPPGAVLLDLLPEARIEPAWSGPRVCACHDGGYQPQAGEQGWRVSIHHLRGIGQALLLAQRGETVLAAEEEPAARLTRLGLRVLVAEDNPINQLLLKEQLEELGCTATIAANGQEALQHWAPGAFDVLLTDVNMPQMNGYELVRALRQRDARIPVIGVTANAMREEGERCMAVGMNAWLVKPMSLRTLHNGLRRVCDGIALPLVETPEAAALLEDDERIEVSPKMRVLFVRTMREDIEKARTALQQGDLDGVRQVVHRLRGALAVVQAHALANACGVMEDTLIAERPGDALDAAVEALLERVEKALAAP
ncbi:Sensor histidine kinase RcsC [compost metagenome]